MSCPLLDFKCGANFVVPVVRMFVSVELSATGLNQSVLRCRVRRPNIGLSLCLDSGTEWFGLCYE
jgi:hypothetical protein